MTNKTWGGRFKKPLDAAVAQFNASLSFDHVLYQHDIQGSLAHVAMLGRQGLLSEEDILQISTALKQIAEEISRGIHDLDPAFEDVHMFIEQLLIAKIGDVGKKLHTGRSRNDQVALDLRLFAREACDDIQILLQQLLDTLFRASTQYAGVMMPGYTHLQQAQPIALSTWFGAWFAMFSRDKSRLHDWHERMNYSPLGAGALAGSSLPLDRHWVAKTLGFKGIMDNTLDAVSSRDFIIEFTSVAAIIMVHLSRLCEDLVLWATQEFGYVSLDDAFATGSSLMPNKKNPDVPELVRGKSGRVFGSLMGILTVMKGLPLAYNKDMQEDKEGLFDTIHTLKACLGIIRPFLQSLTFNTAHMQESATGGYLDATAVLESLVAEGMAFRDAHHQVGEWVSQAMAAGRPLNEIVKAHLSCEGKGAALTLPFAAQEPSKTRHLLSGEELSADDVMDILAMATRLRQHPADYQQLLAGKSLVMLFEKPSLRTRLSFARAIQSLGGTVIESVSTTRKSELPKDVIRVLAGYCDFVMIRTHDDQVFKDMAPYATIPIINGLSALFHPCQVLADLLTLQQYFHGLSGLTVAFVGDGNNILHSLMQLAPGLGITLRFCCPDGHQPNERILNDLQQKYGHAILPCLTPQQAVHNAHAVYTDVWTSMGFEEQTRDHDFHGFQVNEQLMSLAKPEAVFMHCMPMERGREVSETLPDDPRSVIFTQSENRWHVQKALLLFLQGITKLPG